jgi:IS1 family transposase
VDRNRNEVVAHYIGNGTIGAARELYEQVKHHHIRIAATDGNYCYDKVILKYVRHVADKAETCLVEAKNSSLRAMLARLNRRTKRYSKCPIMLRQALAMWRFPDIALSIYA